MPQQRDQSNRSPQLRDLEEQFRAVFHEALDVIFIVDGSTGTILDANRTTTRLLGYERDDIIGKSFTSLTPHDTISTPEMMREIRTFDGILEPLDFLRADGSQCLMNVAASIIPWGGNRAIMLTLRDISERRKHEQALEESEMRHRLLLNSIQSPTLALDRNMTILYCNTAYAELVGSSIGELEGQSLVERFPDFTKRPSFKAYQEVLATGQSQTVEGPIGERYLRATVYPTRWGLLALSEDITEQMEYAAKIELSEQRYRQMFERNQAIKLLIDPEEGTIVDANPAAAAFYGYTLDELKQQNIKDINILSDEEVQTELEAAKNEKRRFFHFSHRLASGDVRDVEVHSGPVDLEERRYLYSVIHDVTERNRLEAALRESEARYRGILEDQTELICRFLEDGTITYVNPAVCRYFEVAEGGLVGKPFIPTIHDDDVRTIIAGFRMLDVQKPVFNFETRIWRTEDDLRWVSCTARVILDKNGKSREYQVVGRDVTQQKQTEQARRELDRRREQARVLTSFIQDASHEFRTPLSIITTNLYLLKRNLDPDNNQERFEMIEKEADHIMELVEGLVTMARLDQDLVYEVMPVNLNDIVGDQMKQAGRLLEMKGLKTALNLLPSLSAISGNAADLHLAFGNILDNAIRFTGEGGMIHIETGQENHEVYVKIKDSGIGMSAAVLSHIFERFYRADEAHTTRGFGLGLSIAQRIIEGHGGRIEVESEVNVGTTVRIFLPVKGIH